MFLELKHLTTIKSDNRGRYYLINKEEKLVIPIETSFLEFEYDYLALIRSFCILSNQRLSLLKIYLIREECVYCYLEVINADFEITQIPCNLGIGLKIAVKFDIPIISTKEIAYELGFKLTSSILESISKDI